MKRCARRAGWKCGGQAQRIETGAIKPWQGHEAEPEKAEPGHLTASAAFHVAEPEGSAWIDDCGETDDAAADKDSSILFACAGAAAIRADENGGVRRSGLKTLYMEKLSEELILR